MQVCRPLHPQTHKARLMPKGYIIGHITVNDPEAHKHHIERDTPILQAPGGTCVARGVARGGQAQVAQGEMPMRHVAIEFPGHGAAMAACNDPDHQDIADIRRRTADTVILVAEGV